MQDVYVCKWKKKVFETKKSKLTETTLITPASIRTNKTKLQNKVQQDVYFF